jgi:chromosome partitioning protein
VSKTVYIVVANHKGGCGKTTTVINLAAEFGRAGLNTVVVDLDPQANASMHISDIHPSEVTATAAEVLSKDDVSLASALIEKTMFEGVSLIFGSLRLNSAEEELRDAPRPAEALKYKLRALDGIADVVIFDTPPSLKLLTSNAIAAATHLIVPVESGSQYGMYGMADLLRHVERIRQINPDLVTLGALLTRHDERLNVCKLMSQEALKNVGKLMDTRISSSTAVPKSSINRKSVHGEDRSSKVAREFRALAEEIASKTGLKIKKVAPRKSVKARV